MVKKGSMRRRKESKFLRSVYLIISTICIWCQRIPEGVLNIGSRKLETLLKQRWTSQDIYEYLLCRQGFPSGAVVKNPPANGKDTRDAGLIPGLGRSGVGNGNLLQYLHLGNPMDRGACGATVNGVTKNWTQQSTQALDRLTVHLFTELKPLYSYFYTQIVCGMYS